MYHSSINFYSIGHNFNMSVIFHNCIHHVTLLHLLSYKETYNVIAS